MFEANGGGLPLAYKFASVAGECPFNTPSFASLLLSSSLLEGSLARYALLVGSHGRRHRLPSWGYCRSSRQDLWREPRFMAGLGAMDATPRYGTFNYPSGAFVNAVT